MISLISNSFIVVSSLISKLRCEFAVKDLVPLHYFLGIQAHHAKHGLHLHQSKYILDHLHHIKMIGCKPNPTRCNLGNKMSKRTRDLLYNPKEC